MLGNLACSRLYCVKGRAIKLANILLRTCSQLAATTIAPTEVTACANRVALSFRPNYCRNSSMTLLYSYTALFLHKSCTEVFDELEIFNTRSYLAHAQLLSELWTVLNLSVQWPAPS